MENNKNKKSVKFQGDMLNFCDFIQVFVFTPNHHLKSAFATTTRGAHVTILATVDNLFGFGLFNAYVYIICMWT